MSLELLYQTIQSKPHGSSGRGMSYWETAARCGRKAILGDQHRALMNQLRGAESEENDGDDALAIGTYYHALHELGLRGQLADEVWDQTEDAMSENFLEAVRLYRGYVATWGSPLIRWGATLVGAEVDMGAGEQTGRADAILNIQNLDAVAENTGLALAAPGNYIVDWKTGKAKSERDEWQFSFGNQSINYLSIARKHRPDLNIQGMVFDKIIRHKQLRKAPEFAKTGTLKGDKSFWAFAAQCQPEDEKVVDNLIQIGRRNVDNNIANAAECFNGAKPCNFFKLGLCDRR